MRTIFTFLFFCFTIAAAFSQSKTLPYYTGFDSSTEQAGWSQYRTGFLSTYDWGYGGLAFSAPTCVSHDYNVGGNSTDTIIDWFVSPPLNFTSAGTISLKVNTGGFSTPFNDGFEILYGTDKEQDPSIGTFTVIGNLSLISPQNQWIDTTINIPYVSDSGYIALKYKTIGASWSTYKFDNITIGTPLSVKENNLKENKIKIAPNPFSFSSTIFIADEFLKSPLEIVMYDIQGREVRRMSNPGSKTIQLSRDGLPAGVYFIKTIIDGSIKAANKLIVTD